MAYCPIGQGALAAHRTLARLGEARDLTAAQIALAWVLRQPDVIAIPKAVSDAHQRENWAAANMTLSKAELAAIDAAFSTASAQARVGHDLSRRPRPFRSALRRTHCRVDSEVIA